jgi:hypothetical protein
MNTTTFMITTFLALWILFITTMLLWLVHQHFALSTELASVTTKNTALLAAIEAQRWRQPPAPTRCNHVIHDEMASYHLDAMIVRLMCLELANAKAQHDKLAALEFNIAYLSRALVLARAPPPIPAETELSKVRVRVAKIEAVVRKGAVMHSRLEKGLGEVELGLDNARDDLVEQYAEILGVSVNEAEEQVGGAGFEDVVVVVLASLLQTVKSLSEGM